MTGKVLELKNLSSSESLADSIVSMYDRFHKQTKSWREECLEIRNYIFATDTSKTSNSSLPWKNSTTYPKLCQIRDNLHSNYMAALFPNDDWLKWEGYTLDDEEVEKKEAIQAYIQNKAREDNLISTMSQLIYDYIDYGNAFAEVEYVNEFSIDELTGDEIMDYSGPRVRRISPLDITINPIATSFKDTPKFTRKLKSIGELKIDFQDYPEKYYYEDALLKSEEIRNKTTGGYFSYEDFEKAISYQIDGFGSMYEYYQSPFVEIIEAEGDFHDPETGELLKNHIITIIDRKFIVRKQPIPSWLAKGNKAHVRWRTRPDNLYGMSPLANLVGMQYRIDHLENLKADVWDLIAHPPLKIIGPVEPFDWSPNAEIHIDEGGDVQMLVPDTTALSADVQIQILEQRMEESVGAPKEALGIRTPGEKTATEVQTLDNRASRVFQEKASNFEINLLEPILNSMLEVSRRNIDGSDVVRIMDDDLGVAKFLKITRADITAKGKLRPLGARHFASRAQLVQNLNGIFNSQVGAIIQPHVSSKQLAKLVEDVLGLGRFQLIKDNIAIFEQAETQRIVNQAQEDIEVEQATPLEDEEGLI